jgi:hypothetical protein
MTNINQFYKWGMQKNGKGYVAQVSISVKANHQCENKIVENYYEMSTYDQYNNYTMPEPWKMGARHGLEFAFSLIDTYWTVNIHKIEGIIIDTNATIIAYTILNAFFEKIDLTLEPSKREQLEALVFSSRNESYKEVIPDFFNLTLKAYEK